MSNTSTLMKVRQLGATFCAALALGAVATVGLNHATGASTPTIPKQERPAWVDSDGTIQEDKVPDQLPVIGADGRVLLDCHGDPVMAQDWATLTPAERSDIDPKSVVVVEDAISGDAVSIYVPNRDSSLLPETCRE